MTSTISDGVTVVVPGMVLGWSHTRESRTVIHTVIGRPDPDVTLRPAGLRSGTLSVFCLDQANAAAVEALCTGTVPLTLADVESTWADMTFVVSGPLVNRLDDATRYRWVVDVPYAEVSP